MDALGFGSSVGRDGKAIRHADALDHQNLVIEHDVADGFDLVALRIDFDLTRLQRAGKGAGQSAAGSRHNVVERRGTRREVLRVDAVVLGHRGVHSEHDRLGLGG